MIFLKFIAHRGLRTEKIKENTMTAFLNAIENPNISGFEFDVRKTLDNQFVVNHNAFIKTDLIKRKTYKYLKKKYNLPLLSDVLALDTEKIFLVEIKDRYLPYRKFIKIVKEFQNKKIYIMSFHNKVIEKLYKKGVPAKLGILNYILNSESDYHYQFICLLNNLTTPHLIKEYEKRNIEVFLYGILNEEKDLWYEDGTYIVDEVPEKNCKRIKEMLP